MSFSDLSSDDIIRYKMLEILHTKAKLGGTDWIVTHKEIADSLEAYGESEISFNLLYLVDKGLARLVNYHSKNWKTATITATGIDVIEHGKKFVDDYPFMQVAIQKINAPIYGNVVQAIDSQVNFNQQVTDSFKQAYNQLEKEKLKVEQKQDIKKDLKSLEKELKSKDKDAGRIQKIWKSLKKNASWVVPIISQVVMKGLDIAFE